MITIADTHHVQIDGKDEGHVVDAVRNNPLQAADIKAAFDLWFIDYDLAHAAAIASLSKDVSDHIAAGTAKVDELRNQVDELNAQIDALGGEEAVTAKKRAALQARIAADNAALAELV